MNKEQIENVIETLAQSQGFYAQLWKAMQALKLGDYAAYEIFLNFLEGKKFKDSVDLVMFLEGVDVI